MNFRCWVRRLALATLLVPALHPPGVSAQTISGTVVDANTGAGVDGAEVWLLSPSLEHLSTGITSPSGSFVFAAPGAGDYLLRIRRLGYDSPTTQVLSLQEAQTLYVQIDVEAQAIPLAPLTVVARVQGIQQRDLWAYHQRLERNPSLLGVRLFPRERLAKHDVWTYSEFMRRLAPRINKPGQSCEPVVYWNGKRVDPDPLMSVESFEGIEFYPGIGPSGSTFFNPDACGIILVWSRTYFETTGIR